MRYIPAREGIDHVGVFADPEHPQRKAIETVPAGQVLVSDCRRDARAASGGSILLTRLNVRGAAGFVSDEGRRRRLGARFCVVTLPTSLLTISLPCRPSALGCCKVS